MQDFNIWCEQVSVLVLCHTRELAFQISKEYERFSKYMPSVRVGVFFGGVPLAPQVLNYFSSLWSDVCDCWCVNSIRLGFGGKDDCSSYAVVGGAAEEADDRATHCGRHSWAHARPHSAARSFVEVREAFYPRRMRPHARRPRCDLPSSSASPVPLHVLNCPHSSYLRNHLNSIVCYLCYYHIKLLELEMHTDRAWAARKVNRFWAQPGRQHSNFIKLYILIL